MPNNLIPEGFKDDVSENVSTEHKYKNIIIDHFQSHGYELIKTPLIEFYHHDIGKNSFKLQTNKHENKLLIRDDITMQVARLSLTRLFKKKKPLKLCYYGEVVRKSGSMLRPERQFLQIGAECIGEKNNLADVEMLDLAYSSLKIVGIKNISVEISSRIFLDKFYSVIKNNTYLEEIKRLIKQKDINSVLKLINKKDQKYLKDIFNCTGSFFDKKTLLEDLKIDKKNIDEIEKIKDVIINFCNNNKKVNIFLDLCEVDDKNYHKGIRFTFFAENVRGEIARGGRYVVKNSNKIDEATGFTCYMDTILRASSLKQTKKKIMVTLNLNKNIKKDLIKKGFIIVTHFEESKYTKIKAIEQNCKYFFDGKIVRSIK
tara:strand:+ start:153 stop:1268 length:1116 start_codon:yes stop_codon:yes gene_type:complete